VLEYWLVGWGSISIGVLVMWLLTQVGVGTVLLSGTFAVLGAYDYAFGAGNAVLYFGSIAIVFLTIGFIVNRE